MDRGLILSIIFCISRSEFRLHVGKGDFELLPSVWVGTFWGIYVHVGAV